MHGFSARCIGELSLGLPAEVIVDSYPEETFKGKVVAILPQALPALRVLPVYIEIPNPDGRIKASVTGFARVFVSERHDCAPQTAVMQDNYRTTVFCIKDSRAELRE